MNTAQQILGVYGVVIIAYGLVFDVPLAAARSKAPHVSRHLVTTHLSAIMQGQCSRALRVPERADISTWGIAPRCRSGAPPCALPGGGRCPA